MARPKKTYHCNQCGGILVNMYAKLCRKCYIGNKHKNKNRYYCEDCKNELTHPGSLCRICSKNRTIAKNTIKYACIDCGKKRDQQSFRCRECYDKYKIKYPKRYFCKECGTVLTSKYAERCIQCHKKLIESRKNVCVDCGVNIAKGNTRCLSCYKKWTKQEGSLSKMGEANPRWKPKIKKQCKLCHNIFFVIPSLAHAGLCGLECAGKVASKRMKLNNPMKDKDIAKKMGNTMRKKWQDKEYVKRRIAKWHKSPNLLEIQLTEFFIKHQIPFKFVGDGSFWITAKSGKHRCPDFVNSKLKKVILVCGNYWHTEEEMQQQIEDYRSRSFDVLTLWDREIMTNRNPPYLLKEQMIISEVNKFMGET